MTVPALKVRNLSVAFHTPHGQEQVVDGISFGLAAGEIAGLVGESGCGKSVTARALMGLLPAHIAETSSAGIQLASTEISGLDNRGWRAIRGKEMAMVSQDPFLFAGSVRENMVFGRPEATDQELIEAAKRAHAHGFIRTILA